MAFNDGFYYEDKDDVEFDKDVISSLTGLKDGGATTLHLHSTLQVKAINSLIPTETGTTFSVKNQKMVVASSKKLSKIPRKLHFNQLASTKYPEVDLPTIGSMLAIWADRPSAEYKEEEIFELMTAFADHNKDYFRADYNVLREELAQIPTNLEGYSKESLDALNAAKEALNYNLNRSKQAELDALVGKLKGRSSRPQTICNSFRKPRWKWTSC